MKPFALSAILLLALAISTGANAGCEASIVTGTHSALTHQEASAGALEDANDRCYPGTASKMNLDCNNVEPSEAGTEPLVRCEQSVNCTICGDDLIRKYEAMD